MAAHQPGNCSTLDSMSRESISLSLARNRASALDLHYFLRAAQEESFRGRGSDLLVAGRGIQSIESESRVRDPLEPFEFRHSHSERIGWSGHASQRINVDVCDCQTLTQNKMCSFLHGSSFPRCLRYRLGLLAVDPKLGEMKWRLQNA